MDLANSDADFDSYWEEEARNPNRNRIRIGRQYQATVPPLLKPGESDGRKLEELETLRWKPNNQLTDHQLDQYLSVAKAVSLFARTIDNNYNNHTSNDDERHCEDNNTSATNESNNNNNASDENNSSGDNDDKNNKTTDETSEKDSSPGDQICSALKGLSEFVTSHHPGHHDEGCRMSTFGQLKGDSSSDKITPTGLMAGEWTINETELFTKAYEVCGKNFSAIKKDYLPWKPVKSIIQRYYLGSDKESNQSDVNSPSDGKAFNSLYKKFSDSKQQVNSSNENSESKNSEESAFCSSNDTANGQEVKPLKAKPILPSVIQESSSSNSTSTSSLGSLKFYMDGQLVLKLNAQQEQDGNKCQWIESQDTPKMMRPVKKRGKKLSIDKPDGDVHQNHSTNNNKLNLNSDEIDEGSVESSDDDSMESNESSIISSPSAVIAKKARVKIENSSVKPLSSPNSMCSIKEQRNENSIQCNRNLIKNESISPIIKKEMSNHSPPINYDERKKKIFNYDGNQMERKIKGSPSSSLENKWYHTIIEKNSPNHYPPKAHSASSSSQINRQLRCDITSNSIPVDLTRKSTSCSPIETKSSSSSSTPNSALDFKQKIIESPSPPQLNQLNFPSHLQISPNQSKKDIKSPNLCQKVDGKLIKMSPPDSPSVSTSSSPSQLAWLQNSFVPYLPISIYEQYYRYYCTYGMPPPNLCPDERSSSQGPIENKEERTRSMFVERGDGKYPKTSLIKPDNG